MTPATEASLKKVAVFQLSNFRYSPFARHLANLAPEFLRRGVQVDLLVAHPDGMDVLPASVRGFVLGQAFARWRKIPRHYVAIFELAAYFRRESPDAIICRGISFAVPALLARALVPNKPVVILTLHSDLAHDVKNKVYRSSFMLRWLARFAIHHADRTASVSDGVRTSYAGLSRRGDARSCTIHNPVVSQALVASAECDVSDPWLAGDRPFRTVLMVARLAPEKDHVTAFKALALLRQKEDIRLLVVGGGPLLDELVGVARELEIEQAVRFVGRQDNPQALMRQADVLVLSSTTEGLPGVLIQAIAVGCPVVATDCPWGPAEILEGGKWGPLVPMGDPEALAAGIRTALDRPVARHLLVERGRDFSAAASVEQFLDLIQRAKAERRKHP